MGGGGGGGYFSGDPTRIMRALKDSQAKTDNAEFEANCNVALQKLLPDINNRDARAVDRHLTDIKEVLEKDLEGTIDLRFGGSVAKNTYVEGLSDIDSLVLLDSCELADGPPSAAKSYFAGRLRDTLSNAKVEEGRLAVTVSFADAELQLLPAVSCKGGVTIADPRSDSWSRIRPREFSKILSKTNEGLGGKLVPVIKLVKAIIATLPDSQQLTGYHAESLGVKIFRDYSGDTTYKAMLKHYFEKAATHIRTPIKDNTGQSVYVDEHLGREGSLERRIAADAFSRVARRMGNADVASSVSQWLSLFEA